MSKITQFIRESRSELKKVVWPSRKQALTNTFWVIGVSLAFLLFFSLIDLGLTTGVEKLISR